MIKERLRAAVKSLYSLQLCACKPYMKIFNKVYFEDILKLFRRLDNKISKLIIIFRQIFRKMSRAYVFVCTSGVSNCVPAVTTKFL